MSQPGNTPNTNEMKKRKRYRNRKKKQNPQTLPNSSTLKSELTQNPVPGSSQVHEIKGLKTFTNLIQLHRNLIQVPQDPKPLMSGPRLGNPYRFIASHIQLNKFGRPMSQKRTTQTNAPTENKPHENQANTTAEKDNPIEPVEQKVKVVPISQKPMSKQDLLKMNNKIREIKSQLKELKESASFISFEDNNVIDLNDDDCFNKLLNDKGYSDKNIVNPNQQTNFQVKLQQQHAKKMETKIQSETVRKNSDFKIHQDGLRKEIKELAEGLSPNLPIADTIARENRWDRRVPLHVEEKDGLKKDNNELAEGLSTNINTPFADTIVRENRWDRRVPLHVEEKGVPLSFLQNQNTYGSIQPQIGYAPNLDPAQHSMFQPRQSTVILDSKLYIQTKVPQTTPQAYSPTDVYDEILNNAEETHPAITEPREGSLSPDESGQKRVSAFQRLGPMSQPKKPKLTINVSTDKEGVREVVDETNTDIPVHDRDDINNSTDEIVVKYLPYWPWKKCITIRKSVTVRTSRSVMMIEKEQMEEIYNKDNCFIMLEVIGYPPSWTKEDVLDVLLENLKDKTFIPCFIEFTRTVCKFFVTRSRSALTAIHYLGFTIRKEDVQLKITISYTSLLLNNFEFIPRIVLRKMLTKRYDGERKLDLSEFTLKSDISHFIYYPLHRTYNQSELLELQTSVIWEYLTELDLSHNKITSLEGFHLEKKTPRLRVLDLSYNYLNSVLLLMPWRYLPLQKLYLQGNPLCMDYIQPDYYVKVLKTIFSGLTELDGEQIQLKGEFPQFKRNYCSPTAYPVVSKFLEVFFPLFEVEPEDRIVDKIYHKDAVMTITCRSKLRYDQSFKYTRNLLLKTQGILEGNFDNVEGVHNINKLIQKWPNLEHDPTTFTVDVLFNDETSTIIKVTGIAKLTASSLADDEPLIAFSRTIHLKTKHGYEYKIFNDMVYWDEPTTEFANSAFKTVSVPKKTLSLKFETVPDDETKEKLIKIFMKLTELNEKESERCLDAKGWHFKNALEYFIQSLKLEDSNSNTY